MEGDSVWSRVQDEHCDWRYLVALQLYHLPGSFHASPTQSPSLKVEAPLSGQQDSMRCPVLIGRNTQRLWNGTEVILDVLCFLSFLLGRDYVAHNRVLWFNEQCYLPCIDPYRSRSGMYKACPRITSLYRTLCYWPPRKNVHSSLIRRHRPASECKYNLSWVVELHALSSPAVQVAEGHAGQLATHGSRIC